MNRNQFQSELLGKNVYLFDDSMNMEEIQTLLDSIHENQKHNEFGEDRYAFLFKPGRYDLKITADYYVQVSGLGISPGDVLINGTVQSVTTTNTNNVTIMFWRSAENLTVVPLNQNEPLFWAVSQAAPYRRMHIKGDLLLDRNGWASGGYLGNSIIEGKVGTRSGQQWFTINSEIEEWFGGQWNRTFSGVEGAPGENWPAEPTTTEAEVSLFREKPFLSIDDKGDTGLFVPSVRKKCRGVSWKEGSEEGRWISLDECYIADPDIDSASSINSALNKGKHLVLTPGIYRLSEPVVVKNPHTIVLGLGMATMIPQRGKPALKTFDAEGIIIAGLIVDAGPVSSPVLIQVGNDPQKRGNADNPISLHDIFCRVGGAAAGKCDVAMIVNSSHTILDHLWLWRADHGIGVGWEDNTCRNGLVVYGDDVSAYGLFNEHFQEYQTLWYGERGRTFFYQSELPYDPPDQKRWKADGRSGFSSYKVADGVKQHKACGLGIYAFLGIKDNSDKNVHLENAVETPEGPGINIRHITTFSRGYGSIRHSLNGKGESTEPGSHQFY